MTPLYIYNGKLLIKDNKLATSSNCCCDDKCSRIVIIYDWTFGADIDLDTKTVFDGTSVGYACFGGNQYMTWGGDNTDPSGNETVLVLIKKALDDGRWNNQTTIELNAYWYAPNPGQQGGPTKIFIKLLTDTGKVCKEVCCITENLPELQNCANNVVGTIIVTEINNNITFDIECNSCSSSCTTISYDEQNVPGDTGHCEQIVLPGSTQTIIIPDGYNYVTITGSVDDELLIDGVIIQPGEFPFQNGCNGAHDVDHSFSKTGSFTVSCADNHGGRSGYDLRICFSNI